LESLRTKRTFGVLLFELVWSPSPPPGKEVPKTIEMGGPSSLSGIYGGNSARPSKARRKDEERRNEFWGVREGTIDQGPFYISLAGLKDQKKLGLGGPR